MRCLVAVCCAAAWAACPAADFSVSGLGSDATTNRRLIQRQVDAACAQGGGRVVVPVGEWPTGSIEMKDRVELHLPKGAVLKGSTKQCDYNADDAFPENFACYVPEKWSGGHLVWARCARDFAITGGGTIDGNGPAFFGPCDEPDGRFPYYKYGLKLNPIDTKWCRPGHMVAFFRCKGIRLEGVTLANTTAWTCHIRCSDGVEIRNVTVDADRTIANSDGFSIDCTRNVLIEKCVLRTGDDAIPIRASCALHAGTNACENIVVRDCDIWGCCFGIRFGVGTGTIRNIDVSDVRIHESMCGFGFTPTYGDPHKRNCYIENVRIRNCRVEESSSALFAGISPDEDAKVTGVSVSDCVFETLLPSSYHGHDRCELVFSNCVRRSIARVKTRHPPHWQEKEIEKYRLLFAGVHGDADKVRFVNCRGEAKED